MQAVRPADRDSNGGDHAIPEDFDPGLHFSGRFEAVSGEEAHVVRLRVDSDRAPYFQSKQYHRTQVIEEEMDDGDLIVSYEVVGLEEIATFVQGWGPGVRVLAPEALKEQIVDEARAVVEMYDVSPGANGRADTVCPDS